MTRVVSKYFNRAADILNLDPNYRLILGLPSRELAVNLPVQLDSGEIHIFPGYRVQHHVAMGPMQGGLRYRPDLTLDDLRALALWATLTAAVADVPFGGSMGGIVCDPSTMSSQELERLTRRYVVEILDIIGTERDILSPDFSTDQQVMAWIMDTYSMHARQTVTAIVTGKPLELGGSHGSHESIGYGVWCLLDAALKHLGRQPTQTSVAIQGAGRRGGSAAVLLHEAGYNVIAITDSGGGVYRPDGLNIPDVLDYFTRTGSLAGYKEADALTDAELLSLDCDVLVPAYLQNQITADNVKNLRCRILCEAAYGASTSEASEVLDNSDIYVIPAIMGESGGIIVRYFEWVQNRIGFRWRRHIVLERLRDRVVAMYRNVVKVGEEHSVSLREASYILGVQHMGRDLSLRGIYA
ncbi:Glu/Leu/Phe/Val dehydrogenase [Chloracidobacterium validum]|uniref:Glutamate dehydrogenase n=2 Tax=Chloracidobacterium validum TaxID=2821543 RepID=A0ABX8BED5_9BACT|nr:Glu/Leu/Phe/Val dehydrogenase [Chloracidobacterium validum]